jgi:nicotinamide mononucleotide transporter
VSVAGLELAANAVTTVSVLLAGRNSVHTWWTGILGCLLFGLLFFETQLYADVTLQLFFLATSVAGWWLWLRRETRPQSDLQNSSGRTLWAGAITALLAAIAYGALLAFTTDAYAPFVDSLVLSFSVLAQILLMRRRVEAWWFWILVNLIAVPLYFSRDLRLTAFVYAVYLVNAVISLRYWKRLSVKPAA